MASGWALVCTSGTFYQGGLLHSPSPRRSTSYFDVGEVGLDPMPFQTRLTSCVVSRTAGQAPLLHT